MPKTASLAPFLYTTSNTPMDIALMDRMRQQDITPVRTDPSLPRFSIVVGPSPFSMPRGWEFFLTSPYEGVTYIATVAHNAGYPVRIIDVRYELDPVRAAYDQLIDSTDVVGIATFEDNFPFVEQLTAAIKASRPRLPIILGGSLVTSVPHVFMEHTAADVAVISEGELTILELLDSFACGLWPRKLSEINGIWYRDADGRACATRPRGQMPDLDSLPRMRLDLWPQSQGPGGLQPQIIASYSRGCKMDCSFCYRTTPQERVKSPEVFDRDLRHLREQYGTEFIFFVDLTFTAHKAQTLGYLDVLDQHGLSWTCLTRCADVDPEVLGRMKGAGCDIILFGVESLGTNILKTARKGNSENVTNRTMWQSWDAGVRFSGLLILGLPGETEESLDHACRWAEEHKHITRVKYLSAMPGTTVYQQGVQSGIIRSEVDHLRWLSIEQALVQDEFLNYNGLPEAVMRRSYQRIYDSYTPGPVLDFHHYPQHFQYFYPNNNPGNARNTDYRDYRGVGGTDWRAGHSSAAPLLLPGSEDFTLAKVGSDRQAGFNRATPRHANGLPASMTVSNVLAATAGAGTDVPGVAP
ncbi:B12-binding domain-containing radical SAM protein [Azospirillum sp. B506]|uniref:B12-binding domain-containing radical SAM protein n=1 Tax=Azospirillum sp. B506 TaxID=137721 RepID=UPI00034D85F9|nr:radical SAM protein [Azospirillum sp. B506]